MNSQALKLLAGADATRSPPARTQRTFICEFNLGAEAVTESFGDAMHVFLLDLPRLDFAALIPKGEFVTLAMLGEDLDDALVERSSRRRKFGRCFPGAVVPPPRLPLLPADQRRRGAVRPSPTGSSGSATAGVARLYKDGIGSAYRTAKAAARAAVFHGDLGPGLREALLAGLPGARRRQHHREGDLRRHPPDPADALPAAGRRCG